MRPPYSLQEPEFRATCDQCGACATACPPGIIGRGADGYPALRFGDAICTFCRACADACPTGAMDVGAAAAWNVIARVKGSCLSFNGITCRACDENCEADAIRFKLMTGGRSVPLVNEETCTGCGACAHICPNNSIEMHHHDAEETVS